MSISCPKCGNPITEGDLFCSECGCYIAVESINNKQTETTQDTKNSLIHTPSDKSTHFGNLILTNDIITQSYSTTGKECFMHIFLKDISSITLKYKSSPIFLILSAISLIIGCFNLINYDTSIPAIAFIFSVVFLLIFAITQKNTLIITARGGETMSVTLPAENNGKAKKFINKVIENKRQFLKV